MTGTSQTVKRSTETSTPSLSDVPGSGRADYAAQKKENAEKNKKKRRIEQLETRISELEDEIKRIDGLLMDPKYATNSAKLNELSAERAEAESALAPLYDEWEELSMAQC